MSDVSKYEELMDIRFNKVKEDVRNILRWAATSIWITFE